MAGFQSRAFAQQADDNARPHRARIITEYLQNLGVERMEWPAMSIMPFRLRRTAHSHVPAGPCYLLT
ncbi:hypothetical protein SKAU_G00074910 [Synaphobranchus kaupii]|uniref:Uncharacterized protein n=1 Tax=Synaphobranchus kaupii TaxID=118154 RepID=A0A9Q1G8F5_SYNKA|nr:hypothetical protein SKAU_G00074910 [Synaphobranchus kaupii]